MHTRARIKAQSRSLLISTSSLNINSSFHKFGLRRARIIIQIIGNGRPAELWFSRSRELKRSVAVEHEDAVREMIRLGMMLTRVVICRVPTCNLPMPDPWRPGSVQYT